MCTALALLLYSVRCTIMCSYNVHLYAEHDFVHSCCSAKSFCKTEIVLDFEFLHHARTPYDNPDLPLTLKCCKMRMPCVWDWDSSTKPEPRQHSGAESNLDGKITHWVHEIIRFKQWPRLTTNYHRFDSFRNLKLKFRFVFWNLK